MHAPSPIAAIRPPLSPATAKHQEPVPTVVSQMHEMTTGSSMPPPVQPDPAANVQAGVTAYFLGGEQNLLYVEVDGQWVEYVKSAPPSDDPPLEAPASLTPSGPPAQTGQDTRPGPSTQTDPVHWAGYTCHSPDEINRDRQRRIYHDPASRPDLLMTGNGEAPALPLPVVVLAGHLEDPEPWLDPGTGDRFSAVQASTVTKLLRYAPRRPFTAPPVW
jgi:hypothetical protein